jgi:hypothetical protein
MISDHEINVSMLRASTAIGTLIESGLTEAQAEAFACLTDAISTLSQRLREIDATTRYEGVRH